MTDYQIVLAKRFRDDLYLMKNSPLAFRAAETIDKLLDKIEEQRLAIERALSYADSPRE